MTADPPVDPPVFAVVDIGMMLDDEMNHWPTAVIDPAGNPDVADLARVHAVEGIGDIKTEAVALPLPEADQTEEATHMFLLAVMISKPVHCTFGVSFILPAQGRVLDEAADAGQLVIATTSPDDVNDADTEQPLWLAIDLDREQLTNALRT